VPCQDLIIHILLTLRAMRRERILASQASAR
jgi:hypothetical protein